jgi:hypothetical protein
MLRNNPGVSASKVIEQARMAKIAENDFQIRERDEAV